MAIAGVLALVLTLLSPRACQGAREMTNLDNILDVNKTDEECPESIRLEPSSSDPGRKALQQAFDAKREAKGILHGGFVEKVAEKQYALEETAEDEEAMKAKCSKYDVCLLMRQLDMEFYQRARLGKLVDEDFKTQPTLMPITRGNCFYEPNKVNKLIANDNSKLGVAANPGERHRHWVGQRFDKGFRMRELQSRESCAKRLGLQLQQVEVVANQERPRGCYYSRSPGSDKAPVKAYFNTEKTEVEAGIISVKDPKGGQYAQAKRVEYVQVCEMDRTLSQSAAAYYSPYKLKENMWTGKDNQRAKMSTSCSFGMMSLLAKQKRTQSGCAKLLATLEWEDSPLKRKLMSVIANNWCPDVWIESTQGDRTCAATRAMSWAYGGSDAEEQQRAESLKDFDVEMEKERPPKQALTEETCDWYIDNDQDQTLESLL